MHGKGLLRALFCPALALSCFLSAVTLAADANGSGQKSSLSAKVVERASGSPAENNGSSGPRATEEPLFGPSEEGLPEDTMAEWGQQAKEGRTAGSGCAIGEEATQMGERFEIRSQANPTGGAFEAQQDAGAPAPGGVDRTMVTSCNPEDEPRIIVWRWGEPIPKNILGHYFDAPSNFVQIHEFAVKMFEKKLPYRFQVIVIFPEGKGGRAFVYRARL